MALNPRDEIIKTLEAEGWRRAGIGWRKDTTKIHLTKVLIELFDRFHNNGHKRGWERGAYEEMTMEDAEPVHNLDPDGPELPELEE